MGKPYGLPVLRGDRAGLVIGSATREELRPDFEPADLIDEVGEGPESERFAEVAWASHGTEALIDVLTAPREWVRAADLREPS